MYPLFYIFNDWALAFLRLFIGALFMVHGWPKLKDLKATAGSFSSMGFKPGIFWGTLVALLEFFGGLALLIGLYTQIFAALLATEFIVITIWKLSKRTAFAGGWELDVLILAACLILLTQGAGALSVDRYFLGTI